jgi:hypothetical protein
MVILNHMFSYALLEGGLMLSLVRMFVLAFSGNIVLDQIQCFFICTNHIEMFRYPIFILIDNSKVYNLVL